jgi:hypothetical protein
MVYIRDEGSVYDAPIDVVWKYLLEGGPTHVAAHQASARFLDGRQVTPSTSIATVERLIDGRWSRFVARSTDYPPLAIVNEELEGPFAGSKFAIIYTPEGHRTRVDAFGFWTSESMSSPEVERVVRGLFEASFNEDAPAVKAFAKTS